MYKAISLFAGAGGCSLGFEKSGFSIIKAFDNNKDAVNTYNLNFNGNKCEKIDLAKCNFEDIRKKLNLKPGELDIIIGGPPCQGFSTAGSRFWEDPRNKLISNYINALESFKPKWFFMENVEGLLTASKGMYIYETIKKMVDIGYNVAVEKVYAQEYGVPQRRKRVIILGNREGKDITFPQPLVKVGGSIYRESEVTLRHAIKDLESKLGDIELDHVGKEDSETNKKRYSYLKPGQTMKDLPEYLQHDSFKKRSNRRVKDGTPSEKRGGAPSGIKRLSYDEPGLTITSGSIREFVHPTKDRTLTLRECARIQTFPDEFRFIGSEGAKATQIGNAIPPVLAEVFGKHIINLIENDNKIEQSGLLHYKLTKAQAMSPALKRTQELLEEIRQGIKRGKVNDMKLNKATKDSYKKFAEHGSPKIIIQPKEVAYLACKAAYDLGENVEWCNNDIKLLLQKDYYNITNNELDSLEEMTIEQVCDYLKKLNAFDGTNTMNLYLNNLAKLHAKRNKYRNILSNQQFPSFDQIGPRVLIEYGNCDNELLFNWMSWRKWISDLDNRSAQETGYIFEPILASCLGGESISAKKSPIKRIDEQGNIKKDGRQIDCYIEEDDNQYAYELKLRVTIAASGQGRFSEELSFPKEAEHAGIIPVLVVLDPTESTLLRKLSDQYKNHSGKVYIGEEAWKLLIEKAGDEMGIFIKNYIKPPLVNMEKVDVQIPKNICLEARNKEIIISSEDKKYNISRNN